MRRNVEIKARLRKPGLAKFLELEVVLRDGEPKDRGHAEALDLMERLGIPASDLVEPAYIDLLEARGEGRTDRAGREGPG